jgi:16S rRNA (cytosine967-C5)-methyltransferase
MEKPVFSARKTAWKVLNQCNIMRHDTTEILNGYLPRTDRGAQATDIVFGVIRNQGTLDAVIGRCADVEPKKVKPNLWNLLRIGAYELVYAPKTADYGILNEAVELARKSGTKKTAGFINAVLRNIQRSIENRQVTLNDANPQRIIPQNAQTGCLMSLDLFVDSKKEPARHLAEAFSLPQWMIAKWINDYGFKKAKAICFASNRHPSMTIQPNTLYTNAEKLHARLIEEGIECEIDAAQSMCSIKNPGKINKNQSFLEGLFLIQDPTAASAMKSLKPKRNWTIIDLCAAPGGKAMTLAMLMKDEGLILASDIDAKRLHRVRENTKRMRISSIEVVLPNHIEQKIKKQKHIDAIILDVPCSNTGVLARRIEARWRLKQNAVNNLIETQKKLLEKAALMTKAGARIVYSTCSIDAGENQQQIQQFLSQHREFTLETEELTLPALKTETSLDYDGGYVAILKRN